MEQHVGEPKHKSVLSHRKYLNYLPSKITEAFETYPPTTIYYRAPPKELSDFFSYAFQKKIEEFEIFDLKECMTSMDFESPYKKNQSQPIHYYSVEAKTSESVVFYVSILQHESFPNSVVLISITQRHKIITLRNDIDNLVDAAFEYWARFM